VTFEEYLISKKISASAFSAAEPDLFSSWEKEFPQMHPNSFTVQKLNLINPVRRKYPLPVQPSQKETANPQAESPSPSQFSPAAAPKVARPMMKPKPKIG
jgi:hypothetical protein